METDKIYFTCHVFEEKISQSIDFKYTTIRHNQNKKRKNDIAEEK